MKAGTESKKSLKQHLSSVGKVLRKEYSRAGKAPWVIAYSGGKDSTLLLQLVWETVADIPPSRRKRKIYVVGNDTLVESPLVIDHLRESLGRIKKSAKKTGMPIETKITQPPIDQTFWVNIIGRGYIPPTRNFRWCTDRMKVFPTGGFLEDLVREHGEAVLLIGTRKSESSNRGRAMEKRGVSADEANDHDSVRGCRVFSPISDLDDNDVWGLLLQRKPPWEGTHKKLVTLYRNAGGGECPLVLTKNDAPSCGTSSPRFGCWTCTVVPKDKSLSGLIDSGYGDTETFEHLAQFRNRLIELREKDGARMKIRRDGKVKLRTNGDPVPGPFTLEIRKQILKELHSLEKKIDQTLISEDEERVINYIWRRDGVRESGRQAFLNALYKPEKVAA